MSHSRRLTTLIAGILMAILPIRAVTSGISNLLHAQRFGMPYPWIWVKSEILDTLWLAGLPVLFLLLFLAAVSLPFSKAQRYLTVALALMQAVAVAISGWTRWNRDIHLDWHTNIAMARPSVQILGFMEWFQVREIEILIIDVVAFLWRLGLLVFLVGLAVQPGSAPTGIRPSPFQAKMLRAAQFAALFAVVIILGFRTYAAYLPPVNMIYFDTSLLARTRRLPWGLLPALVTPAILWLSLHRYQMTAKQQPQPDSTASAHCDAAASSPEA